MSSILSSVSVPRPPDSQPSQSSTRSEEPASNGAESFGAVLSRSLAPAGDGVGKAEGKAATAAATRRPPEDHKPDPEELVNAMALPLVPPGDLPPRTVAAAVAASRTGAIAGAASPALTGLPAGEALAADLAGEPITTPATADPAEEAEPRLALSSGLTPELAAASQKDKGLTALPGRPQATDASPAAATAAAVIPASSTDADSGTAGQSPQHRSLADELSQVPAETTAASGPERDATPASVKPLPSTTMAPDALPAGTGTSAIGQAAVADMPAASVTVAISPAGVAAPAPAGLLAPTPTPAAMTRALAPEVGSGEWGKALGQQMIHMGKGGEQVAELQLNPPGLGPLKVTLSMNDQQVQAMFVSAHSSVRAAVEAALPQLRSTLADSGISLGNTSVNSGSQQQAAFAEGQNGQSGQPGYRGERTPDNLTPVVRQAMEASRPPGRGISVDTYA
ncbi:flagellar hook-length control protein FliK [Polaromonas sp.]|uniref:flagellar hook-length control protein FliK n=1 Tax=Polaromonas sp. TaxID=1869339 RepID=UPI0024873A4D|nr:flagellar hook-length control protein FliK [Polaromonas sp.]MDI1275605.1 flagellar hook-length control protein FliK [Polaromonas sp.]